MDHLTPEYGESRICPDCGVEKRLTDFILNKRRPDGRGTYCRDCFNIRSREHRERRAAGEGRVIRRKRAVPSGHKFCPRCDEMLPLSAFGSNRSASDGLTAYCRPCHNAVGKETARRLYGGTREYHLRRRYGITGADVQAMIQAQGGVCPCCGGDPQHVDHDHKTGKVRGILCSNCNQALGNVRDDIGVLEGLANYLRKSRLAVLAIHVQEFDPPTDVVFELGGPLHAA